MRDKKAFFMLLFWLLPSGVFAAPTPESTPGLAQVCPRKELSAGSFTAIYQGVRAGALPRALFALPNAQTFELVCSEKEALRHFGSRAGVPVQAQFRLIQDYADPQGTDNPATRQCLRRAFCAGGRVLAPGAVLTADMGAGACPLTDLSEAKVTGVADLEVGSGSEGQICVLSLSLGNRETFSLGIPCEMKGRVESHLGQMVEVTYALRQRWTAEGGRGRCEVGSAFKSLRFF